MRGFSGFRQGFEGVFEVGLGAFFQWVTWNKSSDGFKASFFERFREFSVIYMLKKKVHFSHFSRF